MYWQMRDWINGSNEGTGQKKAKGKQKQKMNNKKAMLSGKSISKQLKQSTSKTSSSKARAPSTRTVQSKKVKIISAPPIGHLKSRGGSLKMVIKTDESTSDESVGSLEKIKATSVDSVKKTRKGKYPVRLNVYSLVKVNEKIKYTGIGIYHSGTEVHGNEWAYGGHPLEGSGIYLMKKPRDLKSLSDIDGSFIFKETLRIGFTDFTLEQVREIIVQLEETWKGRQYHLLYKNCNNFSDTFCKKLCGRGIPEWLNRGANLMSYFPFVVEMIPKEYLTPQALKIQIKKKGGKMGGKLSKEERKGVRKMPQKTVPKTICKGKEAVSISKTSVQTARSDTSQKSNASLLKIAPSKGTSVVASETGKLNHVSKSGGGEAVKVVMDEQTGSSIEVPLDEVEQFKRLLKGELKMEKMKMNVHVPGEQVSDDLSATSEINTDDEASTTETEAGAAPDDKHEEDGGGGAGSS